MHHKVWAAQGLAPQHSGRWCGGQADLAPELRSGGTHHALTHRAALSHAAAWALSPGLLAAALPPRLRMRGRDSWGSVGRPWLWGALRPHQGAKAGSVAPGTRLGPAVPGAAFVSPQVLAGHLGHSRGLAGTAALAPCQPRHVGPSARQPLVPGPGAGHPARVGVRRARQAGPRVLLGLGAVRAGAGRTHPGVTPAGLGALLSGSPGSPEQRPSSVPVPDRRPWVDGVVLVHPGGFEQAAAGSGAPRADGLWSGGRTTRGHGAWAEASPDRPTQGTPRAAQQHTRRHGPAEGQLYWGRPGSHGEDEAHV